MKKASYTLLTLLSACTYPGVADLERNSITETYSLHGDYERVAQCVSNALDREPFSLTELPAPVTTYRPHPSQRRIELISITSEIPVFLWKADLVQTTPDTVTVSAMARTNAHISFSRTYMITKIREHFRACGE